MPRRRLIWRAAALVVAVFPVPLRSSCPTKNSAPAGADARCWTLARPLPRARIVPVMHAPNACAPRVLLAATAAPPVPRI